MSARLKRYGEVCTTRSTFCVLLRMLLEEHRLEQMGERHVEPVEPVGGLVAVMAVAVPAPAGREHHVAGLHRRLLAVDDRVRALGVDDDAQRMRRMPVRRRMLAGQDHLIGADQRAARLEVRRSASDCASPGCGAPRARRRSAGRRHRVRPWHPRRSSARARTPACGSLHRIGFLRGTQPGVKFTPPAAS